MYKYTINVDIEIEIKGKEIEWESTRF